MSNYPQSPPSYRVVPPSKKYGASADPAADPLLGDLRSAAAGSSSGAIYDQPAHGDLPDDFKYGVTVSESSAEIRNAFVRKVYSILFCQILATCIVGGSLSQSKSAVVWVQTHIWSFYLPLFATFIVLGLMFWKRHSYPANFIFLAAFTLLEAFTLGIAIAFIDNVLVLKALLITLGVFLGLTLYTFQSTYDFSGLGPWLFGGLIALIMTSFVAIWFPFNSTVDLVFAMGGCLLFSGYIVYDTYMINNRLSPDEYIMASISLYLDFINLFLSILRLLSDVQER